jgi:hypothetical protein
MGHPSPGDIADIIFDRRRVYDLNTDSLIRQASNQLTARALFEVLNRVDDTSPEFSSQFSGILSGYDMGDPSVLIGFDTGYFPTGGKSPTESDPAPQPSQPSEHYLRLIFTNEDAAYYQFPLFPDLNADFIVSAARKRSGNTQYLRLELDHRSALHIESCRPNPHFLRVEECTATEFHSAPSHSV